MLPHINALHTDAKLKRGWARILCGKKGTYGGSFETCHVNTHFQRTRTINSFALSDAGLACGASQEIRSSVPLGLCFIFFDACMTLERTDLIDLSGLIFTVKTKENRDAEFS